MIERVFMGLCTLSLISLALIVWCAVRTSDGYRCAMSKFGRVIMGFVIGAVLGAMLFRVVGGIIGALVGVVIAVPEAKR